MHNGHPLTPFNRFHLNCNAALEISRLCADSKAAHWDVKWSCSKSNELPYHPQNNNLTTIQKTLNSPVTVCVFGIVPCVLLSPPSLYFLVFDRLSNDVVQLRHWWFG